MTEQENRELLSQDDGRLIDMCVFKHEDGSIEYRASFNVTPYRSEKISKKQYEHYKKLCTPHHEYSASPNFMIEYWTCATYDNGLPNWFNKLF